MPKSYMTSQPSKTGSAQSILPVYYFYGPEDYLVEEAVNSIKKRALTGAFDSLNYQAFDKANFKATEVIPAAMTMPAFSDKRVIVVKDAEAIKQKDEEAFLEYIKKPSPDTCLIFVAGAAKVDKGSAFIKYLTEKGYLKAFARLDDGGIRTWIRKEAAGSGKKLTEAAAARLSALSGGKLRDLKGELEKIILFAGEKAEIDLPDVEEAGLDCREETIFSLGDSIGRKDVDAALRVCGKLSNEPPVKVLGAISWQIRTLLKLKCLLRKGEQRGRIAGELKIWSKYDDYVKSSARFTEEELKAALKRFYEIDLALKSGRMPEGMAISRLILELCGS